MSDERQAPEGDEVLDGLRRVLEALALSSERQPVLFPELAARGEELAVAFEAHYSDLIGRNHDAAAPPEALALLAEMAAVFERMVDAHEHVRTTDVAAEGSEWPAIRELARRALESLGWPREQPPPASAEPA